MKHLKKLIISLLIILSIYSLMGLYAQKTMFYTPHITHVDLSNILNQSSFSEEDYSLLFEQTGLTKPIIDELYTKQNFQSEILSHQYNYLNPKSPTKRSLNFITNMDEAYDENGKPTKLFKLAPYHNGYIFLTKSTYTANWRHGHAALVVDEIRGKTLESLEPGTISIEQNASRWQYYPTFKMMRLKDTPKSTLNEIAQFAQDNLYDIPYNLLVPKKYSNHFKSTYCSYIVWQAFMAFGIDLDSTKGFWISPKDIANSPHLELLQIYGFNPDKGW
ncbi:MAG: hypothetical protein ACRCSG_04640 [Cellulosilyticaceae bacterium]